jgi:aminoglycoside 6-adenylyltransferase
MDGEMMRSEQQMMDLILGIAKKDERVRAVIMGGSRANPNAPKDYFQDFDIIYVVRNIDTFTKDHSWVDIFGERMIMQMPRAMKLIPDNDDGSFVYLMQFMDGNRIDLTLMPIENALDAEWESQSILLLNKEGIIKPILPASDADFVTKKPTAQFFFDCCNEFWWICPYVAKGIWRDELPYAMLMHDRHERDMLMQMIRWYIGIKTDFSVSSGKNGKYFKKFLEPDLWEKYIRTYSDANYDNLWEALFASCDLFRILAVKVAEHFGFEYPYQDDERVTAHLKHVRELPRDAETMYE